MNCSICLGSINDKLSQPNECECNANYHENCLNTWYKTVNRQECPICHHIYKEISILSQAFKIISKYFFLDTIMHHIGMILSTIINNTSYPVHLLLSVYIFMSIVLCFIMFAGICIPWFIIYGILNIKKTMIHFGLIR